MCHEDTIQNFHSDQEREYQIAPLKTDSMATFPESSKMGFYYLPFSLSVNTTRFSWVKKKGKITG